MSRSNDFILLVLQPIARADRQTILDQRLASARLLLLGTNEFVIGFSLFLKACQSFANLGKGLVGLIMALNKFDSDAFKSFERVLH